MEQLLIAGLALLGALLVACFCWGDLRMALFEGLADWRTWAALAMAVAVVWLIVWGGAR
jgi:hypothetical protein